MAVMVSTYHRHLAEGRFPNDWIPFEEDKPARVDNAE
jgi:hypothetical protein